MNDLIGELLPLALVVAFSPLPLAAVIVMLLAPRPGARGVGFLLGWAIGVAVAVTAAAVVADLVGLDESDGTTARGWVKVAAGLLLVSFGARTWRSGADGSAAQPAWMTRAEQLRAPGAAALGFGLGAVNPKNLVLCVAAGVTVTGAGVSTADEVAAIVAFTVVASAGVAAIVVGHLVARRRVQPTLDHLQGWLTANGAAVTGGVLVLIGAVVAGRGLGVL